MRTKLCCFLTVLLGLHPFAAQYRTALPGYRYEFPRDYFNHPEFQTEWWYYTGNLKSSDGRRFGFELTFFRQALDRDTTKATKWDISDLYLTHLALSDLDGGHFYHTERINRSGPGIAGINATQSRIWNGNWQIQWSGDDQILQAIDSQFELRFTLHSEKPPVIHGENGVSQKAEGPGHASHYISLTRLTTTGSLELAGKPFRITGSTWMDHEFFTQQLAPDQTGWDWLSLQLDNDTELMLFRIRRNDGSIDSFSSGTYIDAQGKTTHLKSTDFSLQPSGETWLSPATHALYPIQWNISIPKLNITLEARTLLRSQELVGKTKITPSYWEGAIFLKGQISGKTLGGSGYLEMTGYDHPVQLAP